MGRVFDSKSFPGAFYSVPRRLVDFGEKNFAGCLQHPLTFLFAFIPVDRYFSQTVKLLLVKFVPYVEVSLAVVRLKAKQTQSQLFVLFGYDGLLANVLQDNARFYLLIEALVR
jgi:hypothetical protein